MSFVVDITKVMGRPTSDYPSLDNTLFWWMSKQEPEPGGRSCGMGEGMGDHGMKAGSTGAFPAVSRGTVLASGCGFVDGG